MQNFKKVSVIVFALFYFTAQAVACPLVGGLLDYTCDGNLKFVVTGDSVVAGVGDTANGNRGGYVRQISNRLPAASIVNLGTSGITSGQLFRRFESGLYRRQLRRTDVVIIDVGRNDCRDRVAPLAVFRNIKRLANYLENNVGKVDTRPFVVVGTQIPVRTWRRSCVEQINRILIRRNKLRNFPTYLRFDRLPASVLSSDGLHPNTTGYRRIGNFVYRFINNDLQDLLLERKPEIAPID